MHFLDIRHRTACTVQRKLDPKFIHWLQKCTYRTSQSLAKRPVRCLPEISSFGVLLMRTPCDQCDLHIGNLRSGQHTDVLFFSQMCEDQSLPVAIQHILTADCFKLQTAARLPRLHQKVHLRVMAQRFKVADSDHRLRDRLLIDNAARTKFHRNAKPFGNHIFQDFRLHFSHQLRVDLPQLLVPCDMQLRFFLLKLKKLSIRLMYITILRNPDLIGKHRLQYRKIYTALCSEPFTRLRVIQSGHRAHHTSLRFIYRLKISTGTDSDLIDLFLPRVLSVTAMQHCFHLQTAAHDLHMCQTAALLVT